MGTVRRTRLLAAIAATLAVLAAPAAGAADRPRYDVPAGFTRCPAATALNGFFKWASARHTTCAGAAAFMRTYATVAEDRGPLLRHVGGWACTIRTWTNADGDVYASRHACRRGAVVVRFYGMV